MKQKRADLYNLLNVKKVDPELAQAFLEQEIYTNKKDWQTFIKWFLLACGATFFCAGLIFFFAYNWNGLSKFTKLGTILGLLLISFVCYFYNGFSENTKKTILTISCVIIGVLYAVFGQIYQTGANAFDFFLAWALSITIWVVVNRFYPLWLLYIVLINTVFYFYESQVELPILTGVYISIVLVANTLPLLFTYLLITKKERYVPSWFMIPIAFTTTTFATILLGIIIASSPFDAVENFCIIIAVLFLLTVQVIYALRAKKVVYIAFSIYSLLFAFCVVLFANNSGDFIVAIVLSSVIILVSSIFMIKYLLKLNQKWQHESNE